MHKYKSHKFIKSPILTNSHELSRSIKMSLYDIFCIKLQKLLEREKILCEPIKYAGAKPMSRSAGS